MVVCVDSDSGQIEHLLSTRLSFCQNGRGSGIGTKILDMLKARKPNKIRAKCPEHLSANKWYKKMGFKLVSVEEGGKGDINIWELELAHG